MAAYDAFVGIVETMLRERRINDRTVSDRSNRTK